MLSLTDFQFYPLSAHLYCVLIADPLGLGAKPENLKRYQESEVIHCRWAMLGVAGCLAVELLGQGDWVSAQSKFAQTGHETYFGAEVPFNLATVVGVNFVAMAGAESFRGNADAEKRIYPGEWMPCKRIKTCTREEN